MANILVVDDDQAVRNIVATALKGVGHEVAEATSGDNAIESIKQGIYDVIIADLKMPQPDGISVLKAARKVLPDVEVIMTTGYDSTEMAVEAMKLGARDYLVKPISLQQLVLVVNRALERKHLAASVKHLQEQSIEKYRFRNIVAGSEKMLYALELAQKASITDSPVLITGENGTGRDLIGKTIHCTSARRREPFISVDLSSVHQEGMELELFGSVSRAADGIARNARGAIEQADRGTIFLNEITAVPHRLQERLMEFLEYSVASRLGSQEMIYVDARPIVTSSADVEESVRLGKFRKDLFRQLSEISIYLPPLRERRDDIPLLVNHFVSMYSEQFGKQIHSISQEFLSLLMSHDWPGNVRELKNAIEHAVAFTSEEVISPSDLPYSVQISNSPNHSF